MNARPRRSPFGKSNATGRSSGRPLGWLKKLKSPPKDEPFIWLTYELITSPAWRARSINTIRLIDDLLADYMRHAGTENGNLMATYDQQVASGSSRRLINDAVEEAVFLGLITVDPGGRWADTNVPSRYRLTWLVDDRDYSHATNQWKGKTEEAIKKWREKRREKRRQRDPKKQFPSTTCGTTVVPLRALPNRKAST